MHVLLRRAYFLLLKVWSSTNWGPEWLWIKRDWLFYVPYMIKQHFQFGKEKRENGSMVVVEQGRQKVLFGVLLVVVLPS